MFSGKSKGSSFERASYIYVLMDPRTNLPRYVGKSDNPEKRFKGHCEDLKFCCLKTNWIKGLLTRGLRPVLKILQKIPVGYDETWQEAEIKWIKLFRLIGYPLTNMTEGGEGFDSETARRFATGVKFSKQRRQAIGDAHRGKTLPPEQMDFLRVRFLGERNPMYGRKHTEESKGKMRDKKLGQPSGFKGHTLSESSKQKMSDSHLGKKQTEEHNHNISLAMTGRKQSEETKRKKSRSMRIFHLRKLKIIPNLVDFAVNVFGCGV